MPTLPAPGSSTDWPRFLWQFSAFWVVMALFVPFMLAVLAVTRGPASRRFVTGRVRWWGRTNLRLVGVRLVVEPPVAAELARRRRRVVTFNHASTMDIMVMTALWPDGGVAVVKREMLWLPLMGQVMYFLDFLPLDRGNRRTATASLRAAAERMRQGDLTVMMAPEGTRSATGFVQPFKLGAFHLAAQADAPLVPLVVHGTRQLWPRWQRHCKAGVVTVRLLPERPSGAGESDLGQRDRAEELRAAYAAELEAMDGALVG